MEEKALDTVTKRLLLGFRMQGENPQCILCKIEFSRTSRTPSKMERHMDSAHPEKKGKPLEYFQEILDEIERQDKESSFESSEAECENILINSKLTECSYIVALKICRSGKPHTLAEEVIKSCMVECVKVLAEDEQQELMAKFEKIPLSNTIMKRRALDMSNDVREQIKEDLEKSKLIALQFDESTDVASLPHQLLSFVRYIGKEDIEEKMLFCTSLPGRTTGECLFQAAKEKLQFFEIDWNKCVAICTDGTAAMTGKNVGFVKCLQDIAPNAVWYHCIIHWYALATKSMPDDLRIVMDDVVLIVNYIKSSTLNARLFAELCEELGAEFKRLLFHTEVRWLSRGKVLDRVVFLKNEVYLFLKNAGHPLAHKFNNKAWVAKLCYLADIFGQINSLNLNMQGAYTDLIQLQYAIEGFLRSVEFNITEIEKNQFDAFPVLKEFLKKDIVDEMESVKATFVTHLNGLRKLLREFFPSKPRFTNEWVLNPFDPVLVNNANIEANLKRHLMFLSCNMLLLNKFQTSTVSKFWVSQTQTYPELALKALSLLIPFPTSYLCELGFSSMSYLKNKYRNRLEDVEPELLLKINSSVQPNIKKLSASLQSHPSH